MALLSRAVVNTATSGDQTVVAAVSGKQIRVYRAVILNGAASASTITIKDDTAGSTIALLPLPSSIGGGVILGNGNTGEAPVFRTISGGALCFNLSGNVQTSGFVDYEAV